MPLKTCPSPQLLQRFVDGRCSKTEGGAGQPCAILPGVHANGAGSSRAVGYHRLGQSSASLAGNAGLVETFHDQAATNRPDQSRQDAGKSCAADAPRSADTPAEPFSF